MYRFAEDLLRGSRLQHMSKMENTDAVRDIFYHGQVMSDKEVGGMGLLLNILHQVYHLGLNGYVESRDTFISDDQFGVHDQGSGNADPLALSSGELMGIAAVVFRCQSDLFQDPADLLLPFLPGLIHLVDIKTFPDDIPHGFPGVEGSHGILKDHLHLDAQVRFHISGHLSADIHAVKDDLSLSRFIEADHASSDGGFTGS